MQIRIQIWIRIQGFLGWILIWVRPPKAELDWIQIQIRTFACQFTSTNSPCCHRAFFYKSDSNPDSDSNQWESDSDRFGFTVPGFGFKMCRFTNTSLICTLSRAVIPLRHWRLKDDTSIQNSMTKPAQYRRSFNAEVISFHFHCQKLSCPLFWIPWIWIKTFIILFKDQ